MRAEGDVGVVGITHHAQEEPEIGTKELVEHTRHPKVVALGEAGLDYHYDYSPRDLQEKSFRAHIAAARETGLGSATRFSTTVSRDMLYVAVRRAAGPVAIVRLAEPLSEVSRQRGSLAFTV